VQAQPTAAEKAAMNEPHTAPLAAQTQHETLASQNKPNFASVNQGKPAIAATAKAGDFGSHSVIAARTAGGEYHAPTMTPAQARGPSVPMKAAATGTSSQGFKPFSAPNAQTKTATGGGVATPTGGNQGFRPFTPPNSTKGASTTGSTTNQPSGTTGGNTTFKPFNKPATGTTSNAPKPYTTKPSVPPQHKATPPPPPPQHRSSPPPKEHGKL